MLFRVLELLFSATSSLLENIFSYGGDSSHISSAMIHMRSGPSVASHGGKVYFFGLFLVIDVFTWVYMFYIRILTWILNCQLALFIKWWLRQRNLRVTVGEFGFCKAHDVMIDLNDKTIFSIEQLSVGIEWNLDNYRNFSLRASIKNISNRGRTAETFLSCTVYWRLLTSSAPRNLVNNEENIANNNEESKIKCVWLQGANGRLTIKPVRDNVGTEINRQLTSSTIVIKIKSANVVLMPGKDGFTLGGKADKLSFRCIKACGGIPRKKDQLLDMSCLRVKLIFPKEGPNMFSITSHGPVVRVTTVNLRNLIGTVEQFIGKPADDDNGDSSTGSDSNSSIGSNANGKVNNGQLSQIDFRVEDMLITVATYDVPEMTAIKLSAHITAENWNGKSRYSGSLALQGMCMSDVSAVDPCVILSNELISASWRCSFVSTLVSKRCFILTVESDEIISLIVRPDCFHVLTQLRKEYSFIGSSTGQVSWDSLHEMVKSLVEKHCPRTQISFSLEGVSLFLEMNVYEQLALCTLEDIRFQCTRDNENLSGDFTVKEIEVEDRIKNVVAVRKINVEDIPKKALHVAVIQETTTERQSVNFQQVYGEVGDLEIRLEEELLFRFLGFCGVTDKAQIWGKEDDRKQLSTSSSSLDESQASFAQQMSFYFDRLELSSIAVVCSTSPDIELSDELQALKCKLEIPNGLPPCLEKAKLDFERFLRTGIYYRSFDALVRDVRRHYLKEVGRQSTKILGSLHLLGNMTGLKDDIADGLAELRETGDYIGFVRHVKSGLADSYYKLADSWSPFVKPSPTKTASNAVKKPALEAAVENTSMIPLPGLFSSLTSGLGGWIFSSVDDNTEEQAEQSDESAIAEDSLVISKDFCPVTCSTPQHDMSLCDAVTEDCNSSVTDYSSLSSVSSPAGWELLPREIQKKFKGQEFVRRLKISLDDTINEEKFLCCLRLRHVDPDNKLNALLTNHKVYFMRVGSPTRNNVVLAVKLNSLFKARYKEADEDMHYLELVKRMSGIHRHCLPSPNPEDSPLVRCDYQALAVKAASRINKAKKKYEGLNVCPCKMLLSNVVPSTE